MNILQVTLGFYPAHAWGGPAKVVYQNGRELAARGHRVTVYCTNLLDKKHAMAPETTEAVVDGMRVVYFRTLRFPWWPGTIGPFWLPDLRAYLARELRSFDLVHLNGYRSPMLLAAARAARRAGIPIVTQPHGTLPVMVSSLFLKRAYDRLFGGKELEGISALIALQETEGRLARARGVPAHRIEIIPNGIDPRERDTAPERGSFRRRFNLPFDRPLILFLGRINRIKGTDMLVEAFAQMKHFHAVLAIVGPDDGQLSEVSAAVDRLGLGGRVVFPGLLRGADVLAAFQDADLFVLPSRADAFPFAIVEACMMGTPMVITDRCEIANTVRGRVGDVVPFDVAAFAFAMERLLADHERHQRYRDNCGALLEDVFSLQAVVDRLESVYGRVAGEHSPRAEAVMGN